MIVLFERVVIINHENITKYEKTHLGFLTRSFCKAATKQSALYNLANFIPRFFFCYAFCKAATNQSTCAHLQSKEMGQYSKLNNLNQNFKSKL